MQKQTTYSYLYFTLNARLEYTSQKICLYVSIFNNIFIYLFIYLLNKLFIFCLLIHLTFYVFLLMYSFKNILIIHYLIHWLSHLFIYSLNQSINSTIIRLSIRKLKTCFLVIRLLMFPLILPISVTSPVVAHTCSFLVFFWIIFYWPIASFILSS